MQNSEIARMFEELADLLEIDGANPFRVRAYRNAARTITGLTDSLADLAADDSCDLSSLPGIGKDLAAKIVAIVETGQLEQLEDLKQKIPAGVSDMLRIPGLGPKKVAVLFHELSIDSLDKLREAATQGRIAETKGFGKKTQETILAEIDRVAEAGTRFHINIAMDEAEQIASDLAQLKSVGQVQVAGSCRRRQETAGDLDVLITSDDSTEAMDTLAAHQRVEKVLARGETKQRVRLRSGMEMDLRVVPAESFGAAMQYFTGSKEHNIVIRRRAVERGLKLNEYGLFRGEEYIAGATEEDVYREVGLPWIPPELRENRGEIELAEAGELPQLIELSEMRGDLHMHTTASDGTASIEEMAAAARDRGLEYIAITDHSKRVTMANGLDADRLRKHWAEIEAINARTEGIEILKGIECDILEDATLDLPDDVLAEADWVVAVLHYGLKQPQEQIDRRLRVAVENPYVHAIGHPTGRMLLRREGAHLSFEQLYELCAQHGVMLEINAHPSRLDLDDIHARAAREHGIPIVINTDAHSTSGFDVMQYGVFQARRAGLSAKDVANTRTLKQFRKLLRTAK
ncbi:MAG: DNA polymerase/3'-5' exonuclease PolX [Planctomycetaceae bacterium]|nr:DNA polymerase/3'-5' exonuclease PolX [Planctomycetaceae bacterium]